MKKIFMTLVLGAAPFFCVGIHSSPAHAASMSAEKTTVSSEVIKVDNEVITLNGDEIVSVKSVGSLSQSQAKMTTTTQHQTTSHKSAVTTRTALWPSGIIYYDWVNYLYPQDVRDIQIAIREYENKTNLKFVRRTNQKNFVLFKYGTDEGACFSSIGMTGGKQYILMAKGGCGPVVLIHEIGHALGLIHEQNRCDRDQFVKINWNNIPQNRYAQFSKNCTVRTLSRYDYQSIMHYDAYAFAYSVAIPTITHLDGNPSGIGMQYGLSPDDINALKAIYP